MHAPHFVLAALLLTTPLSAAGPAVTAWTDITVRVYDTARLPLDTLQPALDTAGRILSSAAVEPEWFLCAAQPEPGTGKAEGAAARKDSPSAAPVVCATAPRPRDLVIRIVRAPVPAGYRGSLPLGDALIDTATGAGVLGTIYLDRVEWLAHAGRVDARVLLGRAIAHELGHLLFASPAHSRAGVMRPNWTRDDVRSGRRGDWEFAAPERARRNEIGD